MHVGYSCSSCGCQQHEMIALPLTWEDAGYYWLQNPNGTGPFRIDSLPALQRFVVLSPLGVADRVSTNNTVIWLRSVGATAALVRSGFNPFTVANNGSPAASGRYLEGTTPAYTLGGAALVLGDAQAEFTHSISLRALPDNCAKTYYKNLVANGLRFRFEPWQLAGIPIFDMRPTGYIGGFGEDRFQLVDIASFDGLPRNLAGMSLNVPTYGGETAGVWDYRSARLDGGGIVLFLGDDESDADWQGNPPLTGYVLESRLALDSSRPARLVLNSANGSELRLTRQRTGNADYLTASVQCAPPVSFSRSLRGDITFQFPPSRWIGAAAGYSNVPPTSVGGQDVTILRNGEIVMHKIRPSANSLAAAFGQDGVYTIVSTVSEETDPLGEPSQRTSMSWLKQYGSLVIDTVPPVVGFVPVNDFFIDLLPVMPGAATFADKPLWNAVGSPDRPLRLPGTSTAPTLGVGTWTLFKYSEKDNAVGDRAGNHPEYSQTQTLTIHPMPSPARARGAAPEFVFPPTGTLVESNVRSASMSYIDLRFSLAPVVTQLTTSQFQMLEDGVPMSVVGVSMHSVNEDTGITSFPGTYWRVFLPAQSPGHLYQLQWTPDSGTRADPVRTLSFSTLDDFPASAAAGQPLRYYARDTDQTYVRAGLGWLPVGQAYRPTDLNGVTYALEPCVLAARTAWVIKRPEPQLEPLDVSSTEVVVGTTASEFMEADASSNCGHEPGVVLAGGTTALVAEVAAPAEASADERIVGVGAFFTGSGSGYIPRVPPVLKEGDEIPPCSYFGMTTTFDGLPAEQLSQCSGAFDYQPHASAVRAWYDIRGFTISVDSPNAISIFCPSALEDIESGNLNPVIGIGAADIMAVSKDPYWFVNRKDNRPTMQNVWVCEDSFRNMQSDRIQIAARYSEPTKIAGTSTYIEDAAPESQLKSNEANHVVFAYGTPVRIFVTKPNVRYADRNETIEAPVWRLGTSGNSPLFDNTVRQTSGSLYQQGAHGTMSVYRFAKNYNALGTATLSELLAVISLRIAVTATVDVHDKSVPVPTEVEPGTPGVIWTWARTFGPGGDPANQIPTNDDTLGTVTVEYQVPQTNWSALQAKKTLTGIERTGFFVWTKSFIFSDEQERALASGQPVTLSDGAFSVTIIRAAMPSASSLLLHFDGENGSTGFVDSSGGGGNG